MDHDQIAEAVRCRAPGFGRSVNRGDEMILERRVSPFVKPLLDEARDFAVRWSRRRVPERYAGRYGRHDRSRTQQSEQRFASYVEATDAVTAPHNRQRRCAERNPGTPEARAQQPASPHPGDHRTNLLPGIAARHHSGSADDRFCNQRADHQKQSVLPVALASLDLACPARGHPGRRPAPRDPRPQMPPAPGASVHFRADPH